MPTYISKCCGVYTYATENDAQICTSCGQECSIIEPDGEPVEQ